jgi:hypothetical protein
MFPELDFSALACMSDGFSAGEILSTVNSVLTEDRVNALASTPLSEHEFGRCFSRTGNQSLDDDARFLNFARKITTLDSVWKNIHVGDAEQKRVKK